MEVLQKQKIGRLSLLSESVDNPSLATSSDEGLQSLNSDEGLRLCKEVSKFLQGKAVQEFGELSLIQRITDVVDLSLTRSSEGN